MPAGTAFEITMAGTPQGVVVHLIGDAGLGNADALALALLPISASRPAIVVFDLVGSRHIYICCAHLLPSG